MCAGRPGLVGRYAALAPPLRAIAADAARRGRGSLDVLDISGSDVLICWLGSGGGACGGVAGEQRPRALELNVTFVNFPEHDAHALPRGWAGAFDVVLMDQVRRFEWNEDRR